MRGNQSSPTKDCKYLNRNSSENRFIKLNLYMKIEMKCKILYDLSYFPQRWIFLEENVEMASF